MKSYLVPFLTGAIVGLAIGIMIGAIIEEKIYQKKAISLNYAEYNKTNGNWQWKTNVFCTNCFNLKK